MIGPIRPLSEAQRRVTTLIGHGHDAAEVARRLGLQPKTVRSHVETIAAMIPNPDAIPPYRLVMLWAAHERWDAERKAG